MNLYSRGHVLEGEIGFLGEVILLTCLCFPELKEPDGKRHGQQKKCLVSSLSGQQKGLKEPHGNLKLIPD